MKKLFLSLQIIKTPKNLRNPEQEGVNLESITGAQNRGLEDLLIRPKALEGVLHALLSNAETFPDLNRGRSVTESDDGDVHEG